VNELVHIVAVFHPYTLFHEKAVGSQEGFGQGVKTINDLVSLELKTPGIFNFMLCILLCFYAGYCICLCSGGSGLNSRPRSQLPYLRFLVLILSLEETCPSATLSTTNPTRIDLASYPVHRGEKPVTNRLTHGTAVVLVPPDK
jgi:hypothetical protein